MNIRRFFVFPVGLLLAAFLFSAVSAQEKNAWPEDCRVGMFLHFLPGGETADRMQKEFQVERLADQIASTGADYFVLTMYQDSGWFNAPNKFYDEATGYKAGERCSTRDIPMEMADAMARRGIRFFIYLTGQVPGFDEKAQEAFGVKARPQDQMITPEFARRWAEVFREWSIRYGTKVSGWWVDGCYEWCGFNEEAAALYREALLAGNPDAVIAFNPGVKSSEWKTSDFTAGEIDDPFAETDFAPKNGLGQKEHLLTYLGNTWGEKETRFPTEKWIAWAKPAVDAGLALTIDVGLTPDEGVQEPGGFPQQSLGQVRAIIDAVKGYTPADAFRRTVERDRLR